MGFRILCPQCGHRSDDLKTCDKCGHSFKWVLGRFRPDAV